MSMPLRQNGENKMKAYQTLPAGYQEKLQINLQTDKQTAKIAPQATVTNM